MVTCASRCQGHPCDREAGHSGAHEAFEHDLAWLDPEADSVQAMRVGGRQACAEAAQNFLGAGTVREFLVQFVFEQRLVGAVHASESFDGILAEHALALEEICEELRVAVRDLLHGEQREGAIGAAFQHLEREIKHVRSLGAVATTEGDEG